jgi:hypothetical protein
MPDFEGQLWGVMTRISADWARPPPDSLGAVVLAQRGVRIDAIPVPYDVDGWRRRWQRWWPEGSPAREGYGGRMAHGIRGWTVADAYCSKPSRGMSLDQAARAHRGGGSAAAAAG